MRTPIDVRLVGAGLMLNVASALSGQDPGPPADQSDAKDRADTAPSITPSTEVDPAAGARPGGRGPMGPRAERKVLKQFDADGDGVLDRAERDKARAFLKTNAEEDRGPGPGMAGCLEDRCRRHALKYHVEILDDEGKTVAYAPFEEDDLKKS